MQDKRRSIARAAARRLRGRSFARMVITCLIVAAFPAAGWIEFGAIDPGKRAFASGIVFWVVILEARRQSYLRSAGIEPEVYAALTAWRFAGMLKREPLVMIVFWLGMLGVLAIVAPLLPKSGGGMIVGSSILLFGVAPLVTVLDLLLLLPRDERDLELLGEQGQLRHGDRPQDELDPAEK